MKKTLVILSHPDYEKSLANRAIIENLSNENFDLEVRHLDSLYPHFKIDVEAEQKALLEADNIVLQFPFFWYSIPGLLKHWLDQVFAYNFAYGAEGNKLEGKSFLLSFTIGGSEGEYNATGFNHFRIEELMKPLEQTAYLTKMKWLNPIYSYSMIYIPDVYNTKKEVIMRTKNHSQKLINVISDLNLKTDEYIINKFVSDWFSKMNSYEEGGFFIRHINPNAKFISAEGEYLGRKGFLSWYNSNLNNFKEDRVNYQPGTVEIKKMSQGLYNLILDVSVKSESTPENVIKKEIQIELAADGIVKIIEENTLI